MRDGKAGGGAAGSVGGGRRARSPRGAGSAASASWGGRSALGGSARRAGSQRRWRQPAHAGAAGDSSGVPWKPRCRVPRPPWLAARRKAAGERLRADSRLPAWCLGKTGRPAAQSGETVCPGGRVGPRMPASRLHVHPAAWRRVSAPPTAPRSMLSAGGRVNFVWVPRTPRHHRRLWSPVYNKHGDHWSLTNNCPRLAGSVGLQAISEKPRKPRYLSSVFRTTFCTPARRRGGFRGHEALTGSQAPSVSKPPMKKRPPTLLISAGGGNAVRSRDDPEKGSESKGKKAPRGSFQTP